MSKQILTGIPIKAKLKDIDCTWFGAQENIKGEIHDIIVYKDGYCIGVTHNEIVVDIEDQNRIRNALGAYARWEENRKPEVELMAQRRDEYDKLNAEKQNESNKN